MIIFNNLHKILWFTIVSLLTYTYAITGITRMKALVLYARYPLTSITNTLEAYGIDYNSWDVTKFSSDQNLTTMLYDSGKRPVYYMIIIDGSLEIYNDESKSWESVLSLKQWNEIENYEATNHIRRVIVNNFPKPKVNGKWISYGDNQLVTQAIIAAHTNQAIKIFNDARIKRSAPLTSEGLVHSSIEDPNDNRIIPILYFKPTDNISKKTLAAAILDKGDGREILSFFLQFNPDSLTCTILNHLWITWASRGLIGGYRRVFFNPQIENVFLSTRIIDETHDLNSTDFSDALSKKYRATVNDFKKILTFASDLNKNGDLNKGSRFQIEIAFNGNGIIQYIDSINISNQMKKREVEEEIINEDDDDDDDEITDDEDEEGEEGDSEGDSEEEISEIFSEVFSEEEEILDEFSDEEDEFSDMEEIPDEIENENETDKLSRRMGSSLYNHEVQNHKEVHAYKLHTESQEIPVAVPSGQMLKASVLSTSKTEKEILLEEINKYWDRRQETLAKDELFNFFSDINVRKEFNWFSNTFSNKIMVNITHTEIRDEILRNIEIAMHLGLISRDLSYSEIWWSKKSIGTRGSLGYTEKNVVETLKQYNIHYGMGNKYREDIIHQNNVYLPWVSPYGDFLVVPRDKRLILRWASSPLQSIWLYKKLNQEAFPIPEMATKKNKKDERELDHDQALNDWYKILDIESEDAITSLLNLKHDPFVFNQANIRVSSTTPHNNNSIMAQWLQYTIQKYNSYVYWPMISIKSDLLAQYYVTRSLQQNCGVEFSYTHNDTHILSIQVTSQYACKVPITVADGVLKNLQDKDISYEKYGSDPLTVWVELPGNSVTKIINLEPALSYNDNTIIHFEGEQDFEVDSGTEGDDESQEVETNQKMITLASNNIQNVQSESTSGSIKETMEKILNSARRALFRKDKMPAEQETTNKEEIKEKKPSFFNKWWNNAVNKIKNNVNVDKVKDRVEKNRLKKGKGKNSNSRGLEPRPNNKHHRRVADDVLKEMILKRTQKVIDDINAYQRQKVNERATNDKKINVKILFEEIHPSYYISQLENKKKSLEALNQRMLFINNNYLKKVKSQSHNYIEEHPDIYDDDELPNDKRQPIEEEIVLLNPETNNTETTDKPDTEKIEFDYEAINEIILKILNDTNIKIDQLKADIIAAKIEKDKNGEEKELTKEEKEQIVKELDKILNETANSIKTELSPILITINSTTKPNEDDNDDDDEIPGLIHYMAFIIEDGCDDLEDIENTETVEDED